jgi:ABC-type multidrug transport system ATPase subunit
VSRGTDQMPAGGASAGLRLRRVSKRFGGVQALEAVDLAVTPGNVIGLVGPNGAGKTTLLKIATRLIRPDSGTVSWTRPSGEVSRSPRGFGLLLDPPGVPSHLRVSSFFRSVGELLDVPCEPRALAESLSVSPAARCGKLSAGQRRKVALEAALLGRPPILLLDEPAAGLDPLGIRWLRERIAQERRTGAGILMSSHNLGEVENLCDKVVVLVGGKMVLEDAPSNLRRTLSSGRRFRLTCFVCGPDVLGQTIARIPGSKVLGREGASLVVEFSDGTTGADVNRDLASSGIYLDELAPMAPSFSTAIESLLEGSVPGNAKNV